MPWFKPLNFRIDTLINEKTPIREIQNSRQAVTTIGKNKKKNPNYANKQTKKYSGKYPVRFRAENLTRVVILVCIPKSPPFLADLQSEYRAARSSNLALPLTISSLNALSWATAASLVVALILRPSGSCHEEGLLDPSCLISKWEALTFWELAIFFSIFVCEKRIPSVQNFIKPLIIIWLLRALFSSFNCTSYCTADSLFTRSWSC